MSSIALALPGWRRLLWATRLRAALSGIGLAASVALAMLLLFSLEAMLWELPALSAPAALAVFATAVWTKAPTTLALLLLVVVALNLAPRAGPARLAVIAAAPAVSAALCVLSCASRGQPTTFVEYLELVLHASLYMVVVAYHLRGREAESVLLKQVAEAAALETDVKRARLQLLRAQIEPHFLFNSLATILTLSRIDRPAAVEMLDKLLRYFAEALPKLQRDESTLAEELELVDAYLRIHQIRLGRRLAYRLTVPPELLELCVPTMALLTLVENAVKHGIGPALDGGIICVSAARERGVLSLAVADSGGGMTAQLGHGSGLANVRDRLAMLYGDGAALSLAHAQPRGMVATISIPRPA